MKNSSFLEKILKLFERYTHLYKLIFPEFFKNLFSGNFLAVSFVIKKILWKVINFILLPVGVIIVLIMRVIRPWILVRIEVLVSERIGHFVGNTELYLCEQEAGINVPNGRYFDVWFTNWPISNTQILKMWRRQINIGPSLILSPVLIANDYIPGGDVHRIGTNTNADYDVLNLQDRFASHLMFTKDEESYGERQLIELGIPNKEKFVCLLVRDPSYLDEELPWKSWRYHDYRDGNISNYEKVAKELTHLGYHVVRMGAKVKEKFQVDNHMVIDYSCNGMRDDFMDIFLAKRCHFFIVCNSGFEAVPRVFRRPMVYVDCVPLSMMTTDSKRYIAITKKLWSTIDNRFITFKEVFNLFSSGKNVGKKLEIELVESTEDDILSLVLEMEKRLSGGWVDNKEDEILQKRFWDIFPNNEYHGEIRSRMGTHFLRDNKDLLN